MFLFRNYFLLSALGEPVPEPELAVGDNNIVTNKTDQSEVVNLLGNGNNITIIYFQILTCFKEHINIFQVDINKIDSMVFHKLVYLEWQYQLKDASLQE